MRHKYAKAVRYKRPVRAKTDERKKMQRRKHDASQLCKDGMQDRKTCISLPVLSFSCVAHLD